MFMALLTPICPNYNTSTILKGRFIGDIENKFDVQISPEELFFRVMLQCHSYRTFFPLYSRGDMPVIFLN